MTLTRTARTAVATAGSCALGLALALPASAAGQQQDEQAEVSVFHGIPGLTVDVYADGEELLSDFGPGTVAEPMTLEPGSYDVEVFEAGADPDSADPELRRTVEVPAGGNATLAAHLSAEGDPRLSAFVNDTSEVASGDARLTVRHLAAAPAVDVRAGGDTLVEGLENPNEASVEVPADTVQAEVVLAETDDVVIGPADLQLAEDTNTIVYAWGSAEEDSLALAVQTVDTARAEYG
ncbi:DUF4397 domain-containing protein [Streptomyces sp. YIM 98790]|uniref:DUF4397 domain-containing protein n=1 Tax=Streptomyces sp. YIM 98790 TaxID=2689077 RepID=UPI0014074AD7|nr:DUF4397 domain-containing protein [Streptomyces sp. YIM 98790]